MCWIRTDLTEIYGVIDNLEIAMNFYFSSILSISKIRLYHHVYVSIWQIFEINNYLSMLRWIYRTLQIVASVGKEYQTVQESNDRLIVHALKHNLNKHGEFDRTPDEGPQLTRSKFGFIAWLLHEICKDLDTEANNYFLKWTVVSSKNDNN